MVEWKCVPLLVTYCCDIHENKDMSAARHRVSVKRPFLRCMVSGKDIIGNQMAGERSLKKNIVVRSRCMAAKKKGVLKFQDEIKDSKKAK